MGTYQIRLHDKVQRWAYIYARGVKKLLSPQSRILQQSQSGTGGLEDPLRVSGVWSILESQRSWSLMAGEDGAEEVGVLAQKETNTGNTAFSLDRFIAEPSSWRGLSL